MTPRKILLLITIFMSLMMFQSNLISQTPPSEPDDDEGKSTEQPEEGEDFVEEGLQIENPNTKEDIAKALTFFERADRTSDEDAALNDRIEGLTRLQEILTQDTYRDDVIYNQATKMYQGARIYVRNLLENMDVKIIELYKSRYEKVASTMIENAIFNKDINLLKAAINTYPYTDSAVTGAIQGARILIETNKLPDAVALISRLITLKTIDELDKAILVSQLAFCYKKLLWSYELEKLIAFTKENLPKAIIKLGHKVHDLTSYVEDMLKETKNLLKAPSYTEQYSKDGGNLQNSKIVQSYVDPDNFKWVQPLPRNVIGESHSFSELGQHNYRENLKRVFPAVSDGIVYVPQRNSITAFNLYSGARKWGFSNNLKLLNKWIRDVDSAVIYTATCDDKNVYAPIESYVPTDRLPSNDYYTSWYGNAIVTPQKRELVCFDKNDGSVLWRVGAKWDDTLPLQEILSYPIAPTVVGDTAYAVGCTVTANAHFFLAAFDINGEVDNGKRTGNAKLKWMAKIVTGQQEINMFGRPIREPVPEGLAYINNKIVVCTNVGLISTFDATTGEKIWAQLYDRIPYVSAKSYSATYRRLTWFNRPPIIVEDKVIVAPLDSSKMYCYDLNTGMLKWYYNYNPYNTPSRYIIGVYNNKVFFGGQQYLFSVDIKTGKLSDALDLYEETRSIGFVATGKPVIMGNICLIPTRTSIFHIDLNEVKVLKVTQMSESRYISDLAGMEGNLICAENTLIAVNSSNIAVSYDRDALFNHLVEQEKEYPNDLKLKFKIGVLLLEADKIDEASFYFKKIIEKQKEINSPSDAYIARDASRKLYSINYDMAIELYYQGKFKELKAFVAVAQGYAETKEEFIKILLLTINAGKRTDSDNVFAYIDDLKNKYPEYEYSFPMGTMKVKVYASLEGALLAEDLNKPIKAVDYWQQIILYEPDVYYLGKNLYDYALSRINHLIKENTRKVYEKWDIKALELFDEALKTNSEATFETIINGYPNSEICEKAYYEFILSLIRTDKLHECMITIQDFLSIYKKSEKRAEVMLRLYDIYDKMEILFSARSLLIEIGNEFKGQEIQYGSRVVDVDSFVKSQLDLKKYKNLTINNVVLTLPELPLKKKYFKEFPMNTRPKLITVYGNSPDKYKKQFYVYHSMGLVQCLNIDDCSEKWTLNIRNTPVKSLYVNRNLVIVTYSSIYSINPEDGSINWQRNMNLRTSKVAFGDGMMALAGDRSNAATNERVATLTFCNIDDGRILSEFTDHKIDNILDVKFYNNTLLILTRNSNSPNPESIIAFDTENLDSPKYEISLNQQLTHSHLIVSNNKKIIVLMKTINLIRSYDLETGKNNPYFTPLTDVVAWGSQQANEKIFITSTSRSSLLGYDPETLKKKWDIKLESGLYSPIVKLDDERLHVFYRTQDRKYILKEYNSITGDELWKTEISNFSYARNDQLYLKVTENHILLIKTNSLLVSTPTMYRNKYAAAVAIVEKKTGDVKQYVDFVPTDNDTSSPVIEVINENMIIASNSIQCHGK